MTEGNKISRREFIQGTAAFGAGVAATGLLGVWAAAPTPSEAAPANIAAPAAPTEYTTFETDVLVIGAGVGGVESACEAARLGANVIIVDKKKYGRCGSSGTKARL